MGAPSAVGHISNDVTGWEFEGELDPDSPLGYVITQAMHEKHPYARTIAIPAIFIQSMNGRFEWFVLNQAGVKIVSGPDLVVHDRRVEKFRPARNPGERRLRPEVITVRREHPGPLGFYDLRFQVTTVYKVSRLFGEANQELVIEQSTAFTAYSKDPSHEPAGVLKGTRIYPMVHFRTKPVADDKPLSDRGNRIAAIRVFWLFALALSGDTPTNLAGIWKDLDLVGAVQARGPGVLGFAAAEKPLFYEVVGLGVKGDKSYLNQVTAGDWDNIHQWNGAFRDAQALNDAYAAGGKMPPTPGMPYAAHQHWRWTAAAVDGVPVLLSGGKQFGGVGGPGGPLIDPNIPNQTLMFAVTTELNGAGLFFSYLKAMKNGSLPGSFDMPLETFFQRPGSDPDSIWKGEDALTTWLDITARAPYLDDPAPYSKAVSAAFEGTLFAHGLFFAHESLDVMPRIHLPGAYKPMFIPGNPKLKWRRP